MMPFINGILNFLLFGPRVLNDDAVWQYSFPIIALVGFFAWYLHIAIMHLLRLKYASFNQTVFRLLIVVASHVTILIFGLAAVFYGYDAFNFLGYELRADRFQISVAACLVLTFIAAAIWEGQYIFGQWKQTLAEREKIKELKLQHEFDTLKNQVSPHFLFNCFNTLSSLINEDPKQAELFLNELSKVYRYLLHYNEDGLSTVKNEIQFIRSYFQLLQTRHGSAVQFNIETDKRYDDYLLPSLSLQLLVENAVKHNKLSKNFPLTIEIFTMAGNKLAVNNNLQLRAQKAPSNRVGLDNIRNKYTLLKQPGFQVIADAKNFTVVLPLIWNSRLEKTRGSVQSDPGNTIVKQGKKFFI